MTPIGPGRYDELATIVRERALARGVVVIVIDGAHGHGFSVQGPTSLVRDLPTLLRKMADDIEADTTP